MLKVDNLSYSVAEKNILKKISFKTDENLIIIGKNGSGKSTLAKSIAQLIPNSFCKVDSLDLSSMNKTKRAQLINYVPPKLEVFDEYISVREFLELSILDLLEETQHKDIEEIIKLTEIESIKNSFCSSLSSGEGQLLLLAGGALQNSQVTILDEPTTNLDPIKVKLVFNLLKRDDLFKQKIIITHDLNFAKQLGFKILRLEDGEVKFFGNSEEFFNPENIEETFKGALKIVDDYVVECL